MSFDPGLLDHWHGTADIASIGWTAINEETDHLTVEFHCGCSRESRNLPELSEMLGKPFSRVVNAAMQDMVDRHRLSESCPRRQQIEIDKDDPDAAPDLVHAVMAWRGWKVAPNGALQSASGHATWMPGQKAVCHAPESRGRPSHNHAAPQEGCNCGFYGYYESFDPRSDMHTQRSDVTLGMFSARGAVVLHPGGLRSEYADPFALVVSDVKECHRRAADIYGLHLVATVEEAEKLAEKADIQAVPKDMRPKAEAPEGVEVVQSFHKGGMIPGSGAQGVWQMASGSTFRQAQQNLQIAMLRAGRASAGFGAVLEIPKQSRWDRYMNWTLDIDNEFVGFLAFAAPIFALAGVIICLPLTASLIFS